MAEKPRRENAAEIAKNKRMSNILFEKEKVRTCPVCNNDNVNTIHVISTFKELNRVYCGRCGLAYFAMPVPEENFYNTSYNAFFFNPQDMIHSIEFVKESQSILEMYKVKIKGLEIGAGSGMTLLTLKLLGYNFEGIESDWTWAKRISKMLKIKVYGGGFLSFEKPYRYDVVMGFHVIEHFQEPLQFWSKLNAMLRLRGLAILESPDVDNSNNYDPNWHNFNTRHPWEHTALYGYNALNIMARKCGFRICEFKRDKAGMNWRAVLTKICSLTKKGVELDRKDPNPSYWLSFV
jgi:transcription elongation factor Elf1